MGREASSTRSAIRDRLTHRPSELSGGQQQRVAVARALATRPAVVFADEPTGNLDSKSGHDVLELLRRSVDDFGQTIVMVTHDANAASVADRLLLLQDGRIVHDGEAGTRGRRLRADEGPRRLSGCASVLIRGLPARQLRLALTLLAVALGVSLITATYVFTDTINTSFDKIFEETNKGTDAAITPKKFIDTTNEGGTAPTIPQSVLRQVRANPDVDVAQGSVFDTATVLGKDGERIGAGGAPNFIASTAEYPRFEASTITEGRFPRTADEAVIDVGDRRRRRASRSATASPCRAPRRARTTSSSGSPSSAASTRSAAPRSSG